MSDETESAARAAGYAFMKQVCQAGMPRDPVMAGYPGFLQWEKSLHPQIEGPSRDRLMLAFTEGTVRAYFGRPLED